MEILKGKFKISTLTRPIRTQHFALTVWNRLIRDDLLVTLDLHTAASVLKILNEKIKDQITI